MVLCMHGMTHEEWYNTEPDYKRDGYKIYCQDCLNDCIGFLGGSPGAWKSPKEEYYNETSEKKKAKRRRFTKDDWGPVSHYY